MNKCTYKLCTAKATYTDDNEDQLCELHWNVVLGEVLEQLVEAGEVNKVWNEETKEYLYSLKDD